MSLLVVLCVNLCMRASTPSGATPCHAGPATSKQPGAHATPRRDVARAVRFHDGVRATQSSW
jgi:hypothetical protein